MSNFRHHERNAKNFDPYTSDCQEIAETGSSSYVLCQQPRMENLPKEESTPKIRPWSIRRKVFEWIRWRHTKRTYRTGDFDVWFVWEMSLFQGVGFLALGSCGSFTQMGAHVLLLGAKTAERSDCFWLGSEWTRGNDSFWKSLNLCHKVMLPKILRCLSTVHINTWYCVWSISKRRFACHFNEPPELQGA